MGQHQTTLVIFIVVAVVFIIVIIIIVVIIACLLHLTIIAIVVLIIVFHLIIIKGLQWNESTSNLTTMHNTSDPNYSWERHHHFPRNTFIVIYTSDAE